MKNKSFFSRFGLSNRQKKAEDLIERQIESGCELAAKIQNLKGKDQDKLDRSEWVPNESVITWKSNGRLLVAQLFGNPSEALESWDQLWQEDPPSSPYDNDPVDPYLNRIQQINAHLEGLRKNPSLSRNPIERIQDQIKRHPVAGPIIAVALLLGSILAVARGVHWLWNLCCGG